MYPDQGEVEGSSDAVLCALCMFWQGEGVCWPTSMWGDIIFVIIPTPCGIFVFLFGNYILDKITNYCFCEAAMCPCILSSFPQASNAHHSHVTISSCVVFSPLSAWSHIRVDGGEMLASIPIQGKVSSALVALSHCCLWRGLAAVLNVTT